MPDLLTAPADLPATTPDDLDKLLTTEQVAAILGTTTQALACRRSRGQAPAFVKLPHSRRAFYLKRDVLALIRASRRTSTRPDSAEG